MLRKRSEAGQSADGLVQALTGPEPGFRSDVSRGTESPLVAEDTPVEVHWAEQRFAPVPYNSFGVGPFKATVMVRKGESVEAAVYRIWQELDRVAARVRAETGSAYLRALEGVTTEARIPR